ncbi:lysozyme inhibitor LprI family protein [Pseudoxanthomonas mexicana]|uniref:lysozyme inhibitor LprI family protein n=1 Tax=Pseudoxanthomonas mexicana TaxID=128785 RepID=UPI003D2F5BB0
MDRAHAAWETERDRACCEETEVDEGGLVRPMLISVCKTRATRARILLLKEMGAYP